MIAPMLSKISARRAALLACLTAALASQACGGAGTPPTMQGRAGMLSQTAVAQKCEEAAKGHERPFVVEWDATDLASFEAKAARDTIFVRYEGCKLVVLDRCSDGEVAGKLGAYGTPQFTSGTVQGFEMKNEGDLYAKLPLGAATLSGRVQAGEALSLKYFVSGVAQNTRDAIYTSDLKSHEGWAYNLGAFELASLATSSGEAEGSVAGVGAAGGKKSHEEKAVSSGGKLASCETQDQRACRVPIRLALRAVSAGENPITAAPGAAAPKGDGPATPSAGSAEGQAEAIMKEAHQRYEQGDGQGALDLANKAMGLDSRLRSDFSFKEFRAEAVMLSGKCEDGKRDYRAVLAEQDRKHEKTDFALDRAARKRANEICSAATAIAPGDYITRARREIKAAAAVKDGRRCKALIAGISERTPKLDQSAKNPNFDLDGQASSDAGNSYDPAAICVAESTKKCAEGLAVLKSQCKNSKFSGCEEATAKNWAGTLARMHIDCK
jgi:hypothetical protein